MPAFSNARLLGPVITVKGSLRRASPALDRDHRTLSSDPHPLGFQKRLRHRLWRRLSFAAVLFLNICSTVQAEESASLVKDAEQYIAKRNLKAARIELKKAVQGSRQDPTICVRLAQVYLELGDAAAAESEACALRERDGKEGDYLSILADALLRQYKFAGVLDRVIGAPLLKARSGPRRTTLPSRPARLDRPNTHPSGMFFSFSKIPVGIRMASRSNTLFTVRGARRRFCESSPYTSAL
jgi:hypothetical protein